MMCTINLDSHGIDRLRNGYDSFPNALPVACPTINNTLRLLRRYLQAAVWECLEV